MPDNNRPAEPRPTQIAITTADAAVHDALADRGRPLRIEVTNSAKPSDPNPVTELIEATGKRSFALRMGRKRALLAVRAMLRHHPQPVKVDGLLLEREPFNSQLAHVNVTGNAARYPKAIVSSSSNQRQGSLLLVDGVAYRYEEIRTNRSRTTLAFSYLTADQSPDPEHPNCRRVRAVNGRPNLTGSTEASAAGPPAHVSVHHGNRACVAHGLKGSPLQRQAQAQQAQVHRDLPPLANCVVIHHLWEPYHRRLDQETDEQREQSRYYNACVLDDIDKAVHLDDTDERHNAAAAYALWRNPELQLTPVMRRRTRVKPSAETPMVQQTATLTAAVAVMPDGQYCDLMAPTDEYGCVQQSASIELTIRVRAADGSTREVKADAPVYFDGYPGRESIWAAPESPLMPDIETLSSLIELAYWDQGWEMAGCDNLEGRQARCLTLAERCIQGEAAAFSNEITRLAEGFFPVSNTPDHKVRVRKNLHNGGALTVTYRPPETEEAPNVLDQDTTFFAE